MTRASYRVRLLSHAVLLVGVAIAAVSRAAGIPTLDHVLVVVMENKDDSQVRSAPYISALLRDGASFSDYYAIRHPSQPNYIALWSGSTQGVTSNGCPLKRTPWMTENLGHLLEKAGRSWRSYSEDLPEPGSPVCKAAHGLYARKHNPWTNFGNLDHQNERPFSDLAADIAADRLPALAFVIPNNDNNMHNRSVQIGDAWLARNMPAMIDAVGPRGIVVFTFDENDGEPGNRILTAIVGSPVKGGYVSTRHVTHYTLLRTICDALQLEPPGAAATESPITDIWSGSGFQSPAADPPATLTSPGR